MPRFSVQDTKAVDEAWVQTQALVAVFTGGTSGIGEATVLALAKAHGVNGKGLRLYIVGRNEEAATRIRAQCIEVCPSGQFIFVKADDLALLKDVDRVSEIIRNSELELSPEGQARIDLLCMSHSDFYTRSVRRDTQEGLDRSMSFLYYSRMRFIDRLMPLLTTSTRPARVLSIFGAGKEVRRRWRDDDLSLRKPSNYSMATYRTHTVAMTTLFMEQVAHDHPQGPSLSNVFPGLIFTPAMYDPTVPTWLFILLRVTKPVLQATIAITLEEVGIRMLYLATDKFPARGQSSQVDGGVATSTDGIVGGGCYSSSYIGETIDVESFYSSLRPLGIRERIWNHTQAVFEAVDAEKVFSG